LAFHQFSEGVLGKLSDLGFAAAGRSISVTVVHIDVNLCSQFIDDIGQCFSERDSVTV
jgi:hypothetical protein